MDRAPIVAIAGQGATTRLHKESHQILDLVNLFDPISKYSVQILEPQIVPEVVRKAFKFAQAEKPGAGRLSISLKTSRKWNMNILNRLKVQSPDHPVAPVGVGKTRFGRIERGQEPSNYRR